MTKTQLLGVKVTFQVAYTQVTRDFVDIRFRPSAHARDGYPSITYCL